MVSYKETNKIADKFVESQEEDTGLYDSITAWPELVKFIFQLLISVFSGFGLFVIGGIL